MYYTNLQDFRQAVREMHERPFEGHAVKRQRGDELLGLFREIKRETQGEYSRR